MASTRLPGKVLADINGVPVLGRVARRLRRDALVARTVVLKVKPGWVGGSGSWPIPLAQG